MNANPLTTVGLMLTLAGLVGSFFNVQLSQWLRDVVALERKTWLNRFAANDSQLKAILECKIEYYKLTSVQIYAVNTFVVAFVVFVLVDGLLMIQAATGDPLYVHVNVALWVFLISFICLSSWLLLSGWRTARRVEAELFKHS
jgi:uncharacterized protein (DUF983 family)